MIVSYRGAIALLKLFMLPEYSARQRSVWIRLIKQRLLKPGKGTPEQRRKLRTLIAAYKKYEKVHVYPAGSTTNKGVPASKGRRVPHTPFGTWYTRPKK